jgi:putative flippase GtrA
VPLRPLIFIRSNLVSLFTTALDLATLAILARGLGVNYVLATWLGTVVGSLTNFMVNKYWAFDAGASPAGRQLLRFVLVQLGSSGLNTGGVWALRRHARVELFVARLIAALAVYLFWNYPLNRLFVFRTFRTPPDAVNR